MLIDLESTVGLPVGSLEERKLVSKVKKTIFDPSQRQIIGFIVAKYFFSPQKAISFSDVVAIDHEAVVIQSEESIVETKDIVKIAKLHRYKYDLIGSRVYDNSGKRIGKVAGAIFDATTGGLVRIFVQNIMTKMAFDDEDIAKITMEKVVVSKDILKAEKDMQAQTVAEA